MASNTTNLALVKQANSENWSNDIHNANLEKIDEAFARYVSPQSGASDLNDCKEPGFYRSSPTTSNNPVSGYFAIVVAPFVENRDVAQIAMEVNTNRMFVRTLHDTSAWTAWKELTNKNAPISYYSLIDRVALSKTATDYTFYNNRSLATYPTISIQPIIGGYFRQGLVIPRNHFNSASNGKFSLTYPSGGENVEIVLNYVNDTKINMKYNATGTFNVEMIIDGLVNG